jgi:hypothetical protein
MLQREPAISAQTFLETLHYPRPSDNEHLREGLAKAGLP